MNFINFETVKFRMNSSEAASSTRSVSKVAPESCEPDACLLSTSLSSSSRSCDLAATPSQKYWSMQDIERCNYNCISINYLQLLNTVR